MRAMDGAHGWARTRAASAGTRAATSTGMPRWAVLGVAILVALLALAAANRAHAATSQTIDNTLNVPGVTLGSVDVLGPSTAVVHTTVDPGGADASVFVEYGTNGALNLRTPSVKVAAGGGPVPVAPELLGLLPDTLYGYRIVVETPAGTVATGTGTFSTPGGLAVSLGSGTVISAGAGKRVACTIAGTAGNDRLVGTSRRDVICGLGGNDVITARGGNDIVLGGPGRDRVSGGAGRDRIRGNGSADRLSGNSGADRLFGGAGRDRLIGGNGNDYLVGNSDRDQVSGSAGNDRFVTRDRSSDQVLGGPGRDRAVVNRGDRVRGVEHTSRR